MRPTMIVSVHNTDQGQPMVYEHIDNTYIKDGFYCLVNRKANQVMKFPVRNIFRVIEPYVPDQESDDEGPSEIVFTREK